MNLNRTYIRMMVALLCMQCLCVNVDAANKQKKKKKGKVEAVAKDTTAASAVKTIPTVEKFVTAAAVRHEGMVNIYEQNKRYFMEIPDSLMGRDIFVFVSLIRGSAQENRSANDFMGYGGDALYSKTIRFEKGPKDKVFLHEPIFSTMLPKPSSPLYAAVQATNMMPIAAGFDVKARSEHSVVIDFTDMYKSDHPYFSLKGAAEMLNMGAYQADKSYPTTISTYANNVIFRSVRSYAEGKPKKTSATAKPVKQNPTIWEVASSWYLLPKEPMRPRYSDSRVGYFATTVTDYTRNPEKAEPTSFAHRWRLEPRPEDMEKYKRGELVEPAKPIVFYVDRATPAYLQPYLIEAIEAWQPVFELAGFKNAIIGKIAPSPEEDPDFSMEDARYSIISYKASPIPNAYGPSVVDPRSGEIICSHVGLFHSVLSLAENWYFAQTAAVNPLARKFPYDEKLRGTLVKYIITHEIGHTLGLRHNFVSSYTTKLADVRNKDYVKKHGHGPSIMDYMRFNYAAQPEDGIAPEDLIPRIGDYDKYAIEWGYRYLPQFKTSLEEQKYLRDWATKRRKANPQVAFGTETDPEDPRFQSEDLSDNTIKASELGVKNLKEIMKHIEEWTGSADDEEYSLLKSMYSAVVRQYWLFANHATRFIGGRYCDASLRSEQMDMYVPVPKEKQEEAMNYLKNYLFTDQAWLFNNRVEKLTAFGGNDYKRRAVARIYGMLLAKAPNLIKHEGLLGSNKVYTLKQHLDNLYQTAWGPQTAGKQLSQFDRDKQSEYVNAVIKVLSARTIESMPAVSAMLVAQLDKIAVEAKRRAATAADSLTRNHLLGLSCMIEQWTKGEKASLLK